MNIPEAVFIGIDCSGGYKPFTWAVLDGTAGLVALSGGELEDVLAFLSSQPSPTVAVCAPPRPSLGLVRKTLEKQSLTQGQVRGTDLRMAEYELRLRGIHVSATPGRKDLCPAWVQSGFEIHRRLTGMGYATYPARPARQSLETHPHAAFCALLEQSPLPRSTLEGRLQRQLILHEQGLGIKDPMDFFEEITRHRLLKGSLPVEWIYTAEQLDALVAAFTAFAVVKKPEEITSVGVEEEGKITLPVRELKEQY